MRLFSFFSIFIALGFTAIAQSGDSTNTAQNLPPSYYRLDPQPVRCEDLSRTQRPSTAKSIFNKTVTLRSGTPVILETRERVSSTASVGTPVYFTVVLHVMSEGEEVINQGAIAMGEVRDTRASTVNVPPQINVLVKSVQAVDDTLVPLVPFEFVVAGEYPGQTFDLMPGRQIRATVAGNTQVTPRK